MSRPSRAPRRLAALLAPALAALAAACGRDAPDPQPPAAQPAPPAATQRDPAPPAATREIRYLALGDSFTIGTGSRPEESFPARLAARLRSAGRPVVLRNLGVNGYTTDDVIAQELPELRPFAPTLVTLGAGANDIVRGRSAEAYRRNIQRILSEIRAAGVPPSAVLALPQPDWSLSRVAGEFGSVEQIARTIEQFNSVLRDEAERAGARYIDLFPRMRQQAQAGMFAADGLHPSAAAYEEWSTLLAERLTLP